MVRNNINNIYHVQGKLKVLDFNIYIYDPLLIVTLFIRVGYNIILRII